MSDHVAVGMPGEPPVGLQLDPAEHQRHALDERVCVHSEPDPHPSGSCRARRPSNTVTVS